MDERFSGAWDTSCRLGRDLIEISGEDGRKMGEVGAKLAASCDQDGP